MFDGDIFMQMLFLLAPAGIANTAPVWGAKIKGLRNFNTPVDLGFKYRGRRLLGSHKTYRGLLLGLLVGALVGAWQELVISEVSYFSNLGETLLAQSQVAEINWIVLGALLGLFALLGDAVKSFFKRRLHIDPGKAWPVLDQVDYILGAFVIVGIFFNLEPTHYFLGLLTYALIHPFVSYSAYLLKLKKDRFWELNKSNKES